MTAIPFIDLHAQRQRLGRQIDDAIAAVLEHGNYIMGPEIATLERQLAAFCGAKHAITCSSGTDALVMVLMAKGVGPGDAVFVPSFTFAATAEAVALLGAAPVFVDIDRHTFNIAADSLEQAIAAVRSAGDLKAKGVIPVDLFGQPADYDAIHDIAERHGLWIMADAAQSFGATYRDRSVGTLAETTATSFFPAKPLGCYGDGGAIFTDDDGIADLLRSIRVHGKGTDKYDNARIGVNGRLDTLQAAILLPKLAIFQDEIRTRQRATDCYDALLGDIVETPRCQERATSVWAQYTLVLPAAKRDQLAAGLQRRSIPSAVYYPKPLHEQTAYRQYPRSPDGLPVSSELSLRVLSLPMHPYLEEAMQQRIADAVREELR